MTALGAGAGRLAGRARRGDRHGSCPRAPRVGTGARALGYTSTDGLGERVPTSRAAARRRADPVLVELAQGDHPDRPLDLPAGSGAATPYAPGCSSLRLVTQPSRRPAPDDGPPRRPAVEDVSRPRPVGDVDVVQVGSTTTTASAASRRPGSGARSRRARPRSRRSTGVAAARTSGATAAARRVTAYPNRTRPSGSRTDVPVGLEGAEQPVCGGAAHPEASRPAP